MPFEYIDEQSTDSKFEYIDEPVKAQPEKKVGFFGAIPESAYQRGERNIMGNIFERPGAAIRSALMGKGYAEGAVNPGQVPTFQQTALDAYYKGTPDFPGKTLVGNIPSALGMAGDIATQPANIIPAVLGMSPTVQGISKSVGMTKPAQALSKFLNRERGVADITKHFPKIMTDNWVVNKAKNVKSIVDETVGALRTEYQKIFAPHKEISISKENLAVIPKTLMKEMGLSKKQAVSVNELWEARDTLLQQISEGAWGKGESLKRLRLKESDLINSAQKIKAVILNSMPKEARKAILEIDPRYMETMNLGKKLIKTVYEPTTGTYKTGSLINVYRNPDNAGSREVFKNFLKYNKQIGQVSKDINKYVSRQNIKKIAGIAGATGIIGGGIMYGLRRKISEPLGDIGE